MLLDALYIFEFTTKLKLERKHANRLSGTMDIFIQGKTICLDICLRSCIYHQELTLRTTTSSVEAGSRSTTHIRTIWIHTRIDDLLRAFGSSPAVQTDPDASVWFTSEVTATIVRGTTTAVGSEEVGRTRNETNNCLTLISSWLKVAKHTRNYFNRC